jgi:hypothetical protein
MSAHLPIPDVLTKSTRIPLSSLSPHETEGKSSYLDKFLPNVGDLTKTGADLEVAYNIDNHPHIIFFYQGKLVNYKYQSHEQNEYGNFYNLGIEHSRKYNDHTGGDSSFTGGLSLEKIEEQAARVFVRDINTLRSDKTLPITIQKIKRKVTRDNDNIIIELFYEYGTRDNYQDTWKFYINTSTLEVTRITFDSLLEDYGG